MCRVLVKDGEIGACTICFIKKDFIFCVKRQVANNCHNNNSKDIHKSTNLQQIAIYLASSSTDLDLIDTIG